MSLISKNGLWLFSRHKENTETLPSTLVVYWKPTICIPILASPSNLAPNAAQEARTATTSQSVGPSVNQSVSQSVSHSVGRI